jgi:hypothetical protein
VRAVVLADHPSAELPSREQWWLEIGAILEGNIVDLSPQIAMDFSAAPVAQPFLPEVQATLFGAVQPMLAAAPAQPNCTTSSGNCASAGCEPTFPGGDG